MWKILLSTEKVGGGSAPGPPFSTSLKLKITFSGNVYEYKYNLRNPNMEIREILCYQVVIQSKLYHTQMVVGHISTLAHTVLFLVSRLWYLIVQLRSRVLIDRIDV